jgi:hypothetical protein
LEYLDYSSSIRFIPTLYTLTISLLGTSTYVPCSQLGEAGPSPDISDISALVSVLLLPAAL